MRIDWQAVRNRVGAEPEEIDTLARSNAEQVTKVRQILEGLSIEVATPDEARAMLELKGGDQVAF